MRSAILLVVLSSFGCAQALVEHAAAAAGGSVGGVAGKKVSDGLTSVFEKVDQHAKKAAKAATSKQQSRQESEEPLLDVGPGVPKQRGGFPPPPPPLHRATTRKAAPAPVPAVVRVALPAPAAEVEPAPVTVAELRSLTPGTRRADVLKLGAPAARISMYDDGHLLEIYRYLDRDVDLGVVRLTDGAVSSIQLR